ncbi:related to cel1 protein precursor [Cephalotrichum gorgonifer]|uniref:lytic cellulose monooxygenase (C4-dehydrogenating) n=1 Tax=Cephalotrichum gorgonifer TaxID=2041049 RepID=A0AAE8N7D3_9PEZI|nr:related to cel1 protein precursor [Cephalotrichum gorgonifer]
MLTTSALTSAVLFAAGAAAHGAVTKYNVAGKDYPGYQGFSPDPNASVIQWQWPDYNPTMSCTAPKIRCNGGTSAKATAPAVPGDKISATWQQWTHAQGPVLVWMYKCPGAFSSCDGSGNGWFKIDEGGFHGDGKSVFLDTETPSGWDIAKLVGGGTWTSTIPDLAPGNYLVRHELIALHQANAPQFYAECAQIELGGSGSGVPSGNYLAAIPGYCKDSDPNIKVPINDHTAPQTYTVPGPPVFGGAAKKAREFRA